MSSDMTSNLLRYLVYVPYESDADVYPFSVPENADVERLADLVRNHGDLKHYLDGRPLSLYKCENLTYDRGLNEIHREALEWLRGQPGIPEMILAAPLSHYFPKERTMDGQKIDVIAATKSMLDLRRPESLEDFLRSTALPSRPTVPTTSTNTHGYNTVEVHIFEEEVPFVAIKFEEMASSMVNDLSRVLRAHPVVDPSKVIHARALAYHYATYTVRTPLGHEPSVWTGTHYILDTCVVCLDAVGLKFERESEKWNDVANVKMDSVVTRIQNNSGLAVEDKSPKVFGKHCFDENIDALCGNEVLHMQGMEDGFRAIFFKLTIYMIQENLRWGVINCGTHMRIVRIEYKEGRPYAIISGDIPVDTPPPCSVYSLICYMLLTCDSEISILDGLRVPRPPPIVKSDGAGLQTRNPVKRSLSVASPGDVTSMVLHTTAAAGRILVDIPMMRMDKRQTCISNVRSADVHVVDFLGAGSFGRIFLAELSVHGQIYGHVAVKLARAGLEEYLETEARAYAKLRSLYGDGVPRYYGLFSGENAGIRYWCILTDFCGDPVKTIENLPLSQRFEIFRILLMIHRRGVAHNDFSLMNILQTKSGIRLIDFSVAITDHECSGMRSCRELIDAATELRLTPLHMRFLLLWSLWLDVYHLTMRMQFSVVTALTLFATLVLFQFLQLATFGIKPV